MNAFETLAREARLQRRRELDKLSERTFLFVVYAGTVVLSLVSLTSLFAGNVGFAQASPLLIFGMVSYSVANEDRPIPKFRLGLILGVSEFTTDFILYFDTADWYLSLFLTLATLVLGILVMFWAEFTPHGRTGADLPFLFSLEGIFAVLASDGLAASLTQTPSPTSIFAAYLYGRTSLYVEEEKMNWPFLVLSFFSPMVAGMAVAGASQDWLGLALCGYLSFNLLAPALFRTFWKGRSTSA